MAVRVFLFSARVSLGFLTPPFPFLLFSVFLSRPPSRHRPELRSVCRYKGSNGEASLRLLCPSSLLPVEVPDGNGKATGDKEGARRAGEREPTEEGGCWSFAGDGVDGRARGCRGCVRALSCEQRVRACSCLSSGTSGAFVELASGTRGWLAYASSRQTSGSARAATENEPHSTARFQLLIPIRAAPLGMAYSKGGGGVGMSAVDAILAEAADLVALEQIARLNTAHLGDGDSALPSSLESRFRKLKSLPAAAAVPPVRTLDRSATAPTQQHADRADPPPPAPAPAVQEHRPEGAEAAQTKESSPTQAHPPATAVPAVQEEEEDLERLFGSGARGRPTLKEPNRGRDTDSTSPPPRQACCFGFSPKKPPQRSPTRSKKSHAGGGGPLDDILGIGDADEWDDEDRRIVTELKEQQRKLKKGLEEQVKVSRETAKMARWVKQASARMTHTAAIDDLLSDIDDDEELK